MPRILSIIPYDRLVPPQSGGPLRCYYLLREMAREHEVELVFFQPEVEVARADAEGCGLPDNVCPHYAADTAPPRTVFNLLPSRLGKALQHRWLRRSFRGPADINFLRSWHVLRELLAENPVDLVYFEHLNAMAASRYIRRLGCEAPMVLDAHNVDHMLFEQEARNERHRKLALRLESSLTRHVDACFTCSEEDAAEFRRLNGPGLATHVIPNGVDTEQRPFDTEGEGKHRRDLIFCGSLHTQANRDGLLWFHREIWPLVRREEPELGLTVVGPGSEQACLGSLKEDPEVHFAGEVTDVNPWYKKSGVALAPLRIGSGTRLKILEAMSLGNPVVSTSKGAEGLDCEAGQHLVLADDPASFAEAIVGLSRDPQRFHALRSRARDYVVKVYDWRVIGGRLREALRDVMIRRKGRT